MFARFRHKFICWLHHHFIACKRAIYLISQSLDRKLLLSENVALKLHLKVCRHCSLRNVQIETISTFPDHYQQKDQQKDRADDATALSPRARARIKHLLADAASRAPVVPECKPHGQDCREKRR